MEVYQDLVSGFSLEEYLTIFIAFIYGHIVSVYFSGWSKLVLYFSRIRWNKNFVLFSLICFFQLIDKWWISYIRIASIKDDIWLFYLSLLSIFTLFILSITIFPKFGEKYEFDLNYHFNKNIKLWCSILAIHFLINILVSPALEQSHFFIIENYFRIAAIFICLIMVFIPRLQSVILYLAALLLCFHWFVLSGNPAVLEVSHNLSFVEYLMVFTAFIYGYTCSRFFNGWGYALINRHKINFSYEHLAWSIFTFLMLINIWWTSWERSAASAESINYFILSLIPPLLLYLVAVILFPTTLRNITQNYRNYFYDNQFKIMWIFIAFFMLNGLLSVIIDGHDIFNLANVFRIAAVVLAVIILISKSRLVSRLVLSFSMLILLIYIYLIN